MAISLSAIAVAVKQPSQGYHLGLTTRRFRPSPAIRHRYAVQIARLNAQRRGEVPF